MPARYVYNFFRRADRQRLKRLTHGGRLALFVLLASALIGLDSSRTMLYQLFMFTLALFLVALTWSLFFRLRVTASRVLPKFGTVGETVEYRLRLHNHSSRIQKGLSLFEQAEASLPSREEFINTPEPGEGRRNIYDRTFLFYRWRWLLGKRRRMRKEEHSLPPLPAKAETEIRLRLLPLRRGYLRLKELCFVRPDPFNLYKAFFRRPLQDSLLILPKRYDMPDVILPGSRKFKRGGVALASSIGESDEFVSLRDYRPGDPLRRIHWKSWAKTGKPIVKEYQDEYFVRHALVLDTFQKAAYSDVFEEAVSLAASFAYTVRTQESLLDLMFIGPEAYCFTAGRSLAHTEQMLEIMASVEVCSDKDFDVLAPVVIERSSLLSGCICILLAWDEQRRDFVKTLQAMALPVLVFVVTEQAPDSESANDLQNFSEHVHFLEVGKMQEGLNEL
ncbi:MAG: DUF58 domain-containing protein [bacterium]|nr:DUF58 domain-containing protein [bacterium]